MLAHKFIFGVGGHFIVGVGARRYFGQWRAIFHFWRWRASSQKYSKKRLRRSARIGIVLKPVAPNFVFNIGARRADFY